jgi:adenine-specific DNA-methyltransferase
MLETPDRMNYIGSKYKLINFIKEAIHGVAGRDLSQKIFCDLFAGTGIVGRTFKTIAKKSLQTIASITVMS